MQSYSPTAQLFPEDESDSLFSDSKDKVIKRLTQEREQLTQERDSARQLARRSAATSIALEQEVRDAKDKFAKMEVENKKIALAHQKDQEDISREQEKNRKLVEEQKRLLVENKSSREELDAAFKLNQVFSKDTQKKDEKIKDLTKRLDLHKHELLQEKLRSARLSDSFQTEKARVATLKEQLQSANENTKKTPRWKYILGAGLFIAGVLLIMTGVGAAALPTLGILGYVAFSVGTAIITGGFLYGVYKGIKACFSPKTIEESDISVSEMESPSADTYYAHSPAIIRRGLSVPAKINDHADQKEVVAERKASQKSHKIDRPSMHSDHLSLLGSQRSPERMPELKFPEEPFPAGRKRKR